jgi:hypothetical protein
METAYTSETSVDNYFTRQYIPEEHTRRRENLKSHIVLNMFNRIIFEIVKCGVPTEVQTEFLNIIWRSFGFKGLIYDFSVRGCLCRRGETMSLQPPTGLLFIPWVKYEHEEPCWSNIDKEKPKKL